MTYQTYQPDERAGVWIDQKTAYIISVSGDHSPIIETLESGIQLHSASPDGENSSNIEHSDYNSQDKLQHHQKHELHLFYAQLVDRLRQVDYVYIFGPGEAKHGLNRAIEKAGIHFPCKVAALEAADRLTRNQMQAQVIKFFTSLKYEDTVRTQTTGSH